MPRPRLSECWYVATLAELPNVEAARTRTRGGLLLALADLPDGLYSILRDCRQCCRWY